MLAGKILFDRTLCTPNLSPTGWESSSTLSNSVNESSWGTLEEKPSNTNIGTILVKFDQPDPTLNRFHHFRTLFVSQFLPLAGRDTTHMGMLESIYSSLKFTPYLKQEENYLGPAPYFDFKRLAKPKKLFGLPRENPTPSLALRRFTTRKTQGSAEDPYLDDRVFIPNPMEKERFELFPRKTPMVCAVMAYAYFSELDPFEALVSPAGIEDTAEDEVNQEITPIEASPISMIIAPPFPRRQSLRVSRKRGTTSPLENTSKRSKVTTQHEKVIPSKHYLEPSAEQQAPKRAKVIRKLRLETSSSDEETETDTEALISKSKAKETQKEALFYGRKEKTTRKTKALDELAPSNKETPVLPLEDDAHEEFPISIELPTFANIISNLAHLKAVKQFQISKNDPIPTLLQVLEHGSLSIVSILASTVSPSEGFGEQNSDMITSFSLDQSLSDTYDEMHYKRIVIGIRGLDTRNIERMYGVMSTRNVKWMYGVMSTRKRIVGTMPPRRENNLAREIVVALAESNLLNPALRANPNDRAMEAMRAFCHMKPPQFNGESSDPLVGDHWLSQVRKIFNALKITEDDHWVSIVACQLIDEANEWWESVLGARRDARRMARAVNRTNEPDVENLTWAEFEELFENQYFPETYHEQLREQFEKLEQGNMIVSNYDIKFQSLSRFAPELVASEERKCRHFEKGLHPSTKLLVVS
ncbi:hypothetical protein RHMOL_Rhmol13G0186100 [Rhododendron molle]|uniref:Uncharacterized protein n=1 Tax=Rhododendron molle TaxID=49168 RepID=A0ACC0L8P7_RHOML|nr:hypothetical protein RHMOL_Rhmol13G0186100 [Rhododendron molle]